MKCGTSLASTCTSCSADLPGGAAFCPTCGTPVASEAAESGDGLKRYIPQELLSKLEFAATSGGMEGERRTVTMLFCDLQGSTAAAEQMDPEEWAEVMNGAFEHLIAPVYRYEGTLARLMGDAILAFFGAPIGHEDDPERAVRAGLEILEAIDPYKDHVKRAWGVDVDVRVGINTGLVVVGAVGSDLRVEYTAMGDAVNTAARMESSAAAGTVQISEETKRQVEQLFEFEDLGGIEVKGKAEPVQAYRVVKALPRPENLRGIEGLVAPLIGRDTELEQLVNAIGATSQGKGGIVSVIAEAGLGKSRLGREARAQLADGVEWYEGRSLSYETSTPYAPLRRVVCSMLGLEEGASAAETWRRIDDLLGRVLPGSVADNAPFLCWLLGVDPPEEHRHRIEYLDPAQVRAEAFRTLIDVTEALASVTPIVMVFEDLHWADAASLEFVTELLGIADRARVVIVLLFRPRRQEGSWAVHETAGRDFPHLYTQIPLEPLDGEETRDLVANLLAVDGLPESVRAEVLAKSEGNPFYVEEIIRSLIDRELVIHDGEKWTATSGIADITVPDSLASVLTTRLDTLPESARRVAQAASVVGRRFRYDELSAVLQDAVGLDEALTELQRRELAIEEARIPKRRFRFRHALLQEATYDTVLLKQRTRLHAAAADFIERTQPERVEDLAEHLTKARQPQRALPYLVEAGEKAAKAYALATATQRFEAALEASDDDTPSDLVRRALEGLGQAHQFRFDLEAAAAAYRRLAEEGEKRDDAAMKVSSLNKLGLIRAFFFGERSEGLDDLAKAEEMARDLDIGPGLIEACTNQCYVRTGYAEFDEVAHYMGEVTRLGTEAGAEEPTLFGMVHLANTLVYLTEFDEALVEAEKALAKAEELGNLQYQAELLTFAIPSCHLRNGDVAAATAAVERGIALATQIGAHVAEAFAAVFQGKLAMEQGYLEDALSLFRRTMDSVDTTGVPYLMALGRCVAGTCYSHIEGPGSHRAIELHQESLRMMEQPTGTTLGAWMWTEIGQCLLSAGEIDQARDLFDKALTEQTAPMHLMRPGALIGLIDIALLDGDVEAARSRLEELREYVGSRRMTDQELELQFAAARVAAGGGEHGQALEALEALAATAEEAGMRRILLDVHVARAASHRALGDSDGASAALDAARAVSELIAGDITDTDLRSTFIEGSAARLEAATS
jgi:class 3 adenylate cyclase/tetratricopeptide (TPR) repeat protein